MEVNPSLMASTFIAIVGQRLVRKICLHCREEVIPDHSLLQLVGLEQQSHRSSRIADGSNFFGEPPLDEDRRRLEGSFFRGKGCLRCFEGGYRGRIGIFEILPVSPSIAQMIAQRSPAQPILEKAREEGMTTLVEDGVEKARQGITTLDEVVRVAYTV
jgi:type II secretory ATPase GspE/PulE/Tfp pilus assembly ATPase PilB-like protein